MPGLRALKILSALLTFGCIGVWYLTGSEAEPWSVLAGAHESSRFQTLRAIAGAANEGYYFQVEPGIPMENHWEDPGTGFLLVCLGLAKKTLGLGPLDAFKDPYRVELGVMLLVLCLIYFTKIFSPPQWYWAVTPLFFLMATLPVIRMSDWGHTQISGLLSLGISARWAKVPAALWTFTLTLQLHQWWKEKTLLKFSRDKFAALFVSGVVYGIFISIRKDIYAAACLAIVGTLALLGRKKMGASLLILATLWAGAQVFPGVIHASWKIRDRVYSMKEFPRIWGHPTWHTLYAALGESIPGKKIRWGDEDAWNEVLNLPENKGLRYGSREHERAARRLYLQTIARHPFAYARGLARKAGILVKGKWKLAALNLVLFLLLFSKVPAHRSLYGVLLINTLAAAVVPILVIPDIIYSNDFIAHNYLALLVGLGALAFRRRQGPALTA